ncbi:hypothetical protein SNOG_13251 [Parastagonospora nodorum SN15]|uniref:Serine/threonine-protein phosphatase 2A activator n=1 Tax=Phaeosphaeria nodorum (strain SN15 / ATCC MYA-4574 / FGSC 10173) TaxID=321614 RepID=Q0U4R3_PHANO|nr:hypothetical protein SNOG_13251 [Parastagonospora nodorum SN15]EAT79578.2 hypothetical protein SNOG_13251 [Parastagonospora nodorum SN15]
MAAETQTTPALPRLDANQGCSFAVPAKRINDGEDVTFFLASRAYADLMTFIFQLNTAMVPRRQPDSSPAKEWTLNDTDVTFPPIVQNLAKLISTLACIIDEAPPDPGPRRFGNVSFRKWYDMVRERVPQLLEDCLPKDVLDFKSTSETRASEELEAYLNGSFGSSQRLDYGTGHELSFLAFLGSLWKLGAFPASKDGDIERAIVLGVVEPYLVLIRRLILTYTLEPAGSHGVWGLDDHAFLPYILGSAQFSPAITTPADVVTEGSLPSAPDPADVAKTPAVERERTRNMYFSAIGFIYDVKKGPFWEHSPILYDISGVKAGWAKINKLDCAELNFVNECLLEPETATSSTQGSHGRYRFCCDGGPVGETCWAECPEWSKSTYESAMGGSYACASASAAWRRNGGPVGNRCTTWR